jgi:predicted PurR-regulated permease PerM
VTWPVFARARALTGRPRLTAVLLSLAFALVIAIPIGWVLVVFATQAAGVATDLQVWVQQGAQLPDWVNARPWLSRGIDDLRASPLFGDAAAGEWIARYGQTGSQWAVAVTGGIARNLLEFLITMVVLYALYVDGERVTVLARRLAALLLPSDDPGLVDKIGGSPARWCSACSAPRSRRACSSVWASGSSASRRRCSSASSP